MRVSPSRSSLLPLPPFPTFPPLLSAAVQDAGRQVLIRHPAGGWQRAAVPGPLCRLPRGAARRLTSSLHVVRQLDAVRGRVGGVHVAPGCRAPIGCEQLRQGVHRGGAASWRAAHCSARSGRCMHWAVAGRWNQGSTVYTAAFCRGLFRGSLGSFGALTHSLRGGVQACCAANSNTGRGSRRGADVLGLTRNNEEGGEGNGIVFSVLLQLESTSWRACPPSPTNWMKHSRPGDYASPGVGSL